MPLSLQFIITNSCFCSKCVSAREGSSSLVGLDEAKSLTMREQIYLHPTHFRVHVCIIIMHTAWCPLGGDKFAPDRLFVDLLCVTILLCNAVATLIPCKRQDSDTDTSTCATFVCSQRTRQMVNNLRVPSPMFAPRITCICSWQMWTCCLLGVLSIIPSLLAFYIFQLEWGSINDHLEMACHVVSPVPDGWTALLLLAQVCQELWPLGGSRSTTACELHNNLNMIDYYQFLSKWLRSCLQVSMWLHQCFIYAFGRRMITEQLFCMLPLAPVRLRYIPIQA